MRWMILLFVVLASAHRGNCASDGSPVVWLKDLPGYTLEDLPDDALVEGCRRAIADHRSNQAVEMAGKAASEGNSLGDFIQGLIAEQYQGGRPDLLKAEKHYRMGAKHDHVPSIVNLASLLLRRNQRSEEAVALLNSVLSREPKLAGYLLGAAALSGAVGTPDFDNIAAYWKQSAEAGFATAWTQLGLLYQGAFGFTERRDHSKACESLRSGMNSGDAEAAIRLGILIMEAGGELNLPTTEAESAFAKGKAAGNAKAFFLLGQVRETGIHGIGADAAEARALYQEGARLEHGPSFLKLGFLWERGVGGVSNLNEAIKCYQEAARLGEAGGDFNLGLLYDSGKGLERSEEKAFRAFLAAGQLNFPPAADRIGDAYRTGTGIPQDSIAALAWFSRGAEAGDTNSMVSIAEMMLSNQGVPFDEEVLNRLCQQAFAAGNPRAGLLLGRLAERGVTEETDIVKALAYYQWAAERGLTQAKDEANRLSSGMSATEIDAAGEFLREISVKEAPMSSDTSFALSCSRIS